MEEQITGGGVSREGEGVEWEQRSYDHRGTQVEGTG